MTIYTQRVFRYKMSIALSFVYYFFSCCSLLIRENRWLLFLCLVSRARSFWESLVSRNPQTIAHDLIVIVRKQARWKNKMNKKKKKKKKTRRKERRKRIIKQHILHSLQTFCGCFPFYCFLLFTYPVYITTCIQIVKPLWIGCDEERWRRHTAIIK